VARKTAVWNNAIPSDTPTLDVTTDAAGTGASRRRRSSPVVRHCSREVAAPNVAPLAIAHPSSPGVRYCTGDRVSSSTVSTFRAYCGGCPEAPMFALDTIASKVPRTVLASTGSACE
jgi:hypothetical protein